MKMTPMRRADGQLSRQATLDIFGSPCLAGTCRSKDDKKTQIHRPIIFLTHPLSRNTVIGGGRKKGGHALGDDKRLKKLIILVLFSSSYEEVSPTGHVVGCAFDPLLTHNEAAKWRS